MHLCRSSSNVPRLPSFLKLLQNPHVLLTFDKVRNPLRLPHFDFEMCFAPQRLALFRHPNFQKKVCFVHFDFEMCFAPQWRALFRHLNFQKWREHVVACTFSTSQLPKVVREWCVLYSLTWKCASRHNGVHFFDIATSRSGPRMLCFVHFDLEMCFAPQRCALFRHLNFQKWSDHAVFCTF